jgi:D-arabinan exo alpha-(1,3)/(1,5)-arabinofuranosidase (non-reducing end)
MRGLSARHWAGALVVTVMIVASCQDERLAADVRPGGDAGSDPSQDGPAEETDAAVPQAPALDFGLDAFRHWQRMPYVRIGVRGYMRSTYDRSGGNEAADASHFLRQVAEDENVSLDLAGPGVLAFVRTNHWHGSPWHYRVDGQDHVVTESSTVDPTHPVAGSKFLPEAAFPSPLALTWSATGGADLSWVPIAFSQSFELAYGRTHYGTGYHIYQLFPLGGGPSGAWQEEAPDEAVLALLAAAGSDIAPSGNGVTTTKRTLDVAAGESALLADLADGPAMVRALHIGLPVKQAAALEAARLRVTWDGRAEPSIDAPVPLLFGTGTLYDRNGAEWLVKGLLQSVRFTADQLRLALYFPMPYFEHAKLEIVAGASGLSGLDFELRSEPYTGPNNHVAYFHATYRDHGAPELGHDLTVLDTRGLEGDEDHCGAFVGMSWIFSDQAVLSTLEGDPRFYFDDSLSPQAQGTGTEEWAGGGDYWGGQVTTLPLAGHPVGAPSPSDVQEPRDAVESAYRVLIADAFPFGKNARITLEHGAQDDSSEHYRSVAYWYGTPGACLTLSDEVAVGDGASEATHDYASPEATAPVTLSSRYEWGPDHVAGVEIFPETSDTGRTTRGTSELVVALDPANLGVLLRRKLDYGVPNQRARVYVADDAPGAPFVYAGTWYLAGSNRSVYSNPPGELDASNPVLETSNRRWREDELLLPPALTAGRSAIRLRFEHEAVDLPLLPGGEVTPSGWSEFHYWVYCYHLPKAQSATASRFRPPPT